MKVAITCPTCGNRVHTPDNFTGQQCKCPECGELLKVPGAAATPTQTKAKNADSSLKSSSQVQRSRFPGWLLGAVSGVFIIAVIAVGLWFFLRPSAPKPGPEVQLVQSSVPTNTSSSSSQAKSNPDSEKETLALSKLRTALDSWASGNTGVNFENKHPDIQFIDLDLGLFSLDKALLRYEVGDVGRWKWCL